MTRDDEALPPSHEPEATGQTRARVGEVACVAALVLLGLVFRCTACTVPRMNTDEAWAWYLTANPVGQVLAYLVKDRHPPLHYLVLAWMHAWGMHEECWLRLPGAVMTSCGAALAYLLGRDAVDRRVGLGGALLTACSFLAWEYDTWLRDYGLLHVLALLGTWLLVGLLERARDASLMQAGGLDGTQEPSPRRLGPSPLQSRRSDALLAGAYVVCMTVLLYSHYFGFVVVGVHVVYAMVLGLQGKVPWARLLACWLAVALCYAPWWPVMHQQGVRRAALDLAFGPAPGLALASALHLPGLLTGLEHLPALGGWRSLSAAAQTRWDLLVCALVLPWCWRGVRPMARGRHGLLVLGMLAPAGLLLLAMAVRFPELQRPRYYAMFVPYAGMLLGAGLPRGPQGRWVAVLGACLLVGINLATLLDYRSDGYFRSADFATVARFVARHVQPGTRVAIYDAYGIHPLNFYDAGARVHYEVRDVERPSFAYDANYSAGGRMPPLRLWPQMVPQAMDAALEGSARVVLVLLYEEDPRVRAWFAERYGVLDALQIASADKDGRMEVFWLQRR